MRALKRNHSCAGLVGIYVTTQAREGIETSSLIDRFPSIVVTTQAREGIETTHYGTLHYTCKVTTQAREGIDTHR